MKFKLIASFAISLLLFLVSCSSQSVVSQNPMLTVKPSFTSLPNSTTLLNPTFTLPPTLLPSQATQTAVYPTFVLTAKAQEHYMFTAVPATLEARNAKCKEGFVIEKYLDIIRYSNNTWTLFTCSPVPANRKDMWTPGVVDYGTRYTQLVKTDLSKIWTIQHDIFDYSIIDRPDALLAPYRWTGDGKFVYLHPASFPGGGGGTDSRELKYDIDDLYRINLETGKFELVLARDQYSALELSPNAKLLAYSERDIPDIIHVKDMETGIDLQVKLNEEIIAAGGFVWNSESSKVVITIGYGKQIEDVYDDLSGTAILVLTPKGMYVQKILAKDVRIFIPYPCFDNSYWSDQQTLCLYSINNKLDSWNTFFTIDIKTGAVTYLRPFP